MIRISEYDTPWEITCKLINAEKEVKNVFGAPEMVSVFSPTELRLIGLHLLHYVDTECEEEREEQDDVI